MQVLSFVADVASCEGVCARVYTIYVRCKHEETIPLRRFVSGLDHLYFSVF